ncbi:hypothetical protein [Thermus sp.]|uniref:hypothetical protein n=1 Tax=Thermus sp. TaxID=275 RepID=UPI00307F3012
MRKLGVFLLALLAVPVLALSPEEIWKALLAHGKVQGYVASVRQGPVVYKVAYRRPYLRIDWVEGPAYLKGSALVTDGVRAFSRALGGPWQPTKAAPPEDPLSPLFSDPEGMRARYELRELGEKEGLWSFVLTLKTLPKDPQAAAAWRILINPKGHLPFRYEVLSPSGRVLAQAEYLALEPVPPSLDQFEVLR